MKKVVFLIIFVLILTGGITYFYLIDKNLKDFKYFEVDNSYELNLQGAKKGSSKEFKLNNDYKLKYEFKDLKGEELFFDVYVNDVFITSSSMPDYTDHELDTDDVYLYGDTLVYFSDASYKKEDLFMFVINNNKVTKLEPEFSEIKGLRLSGFISSEDKIEVIASRRIDDTNFVYGDISFNICEDKKPKGFNDETIVEEVYVYKVKKNKLDLEPSKQSKLTYKEYLIEGDEIVCD